MLGGRLNCGGLYDPCQSVKDADPCRPSLKENLCNRIKRVQESSKVLENVLDIASTLVRILQTCGIHECKSNRALDVIIYSFMHFDEVAEHPGGKCKKRIRKEEFHNDLMRDCGMTRDEAKLTYSIVKCAFKAFYHKQIVNNYDTSFVDECEWKNAANRTITAFAQTGATKSEVEVTGRRILCAYENFICRLQSKGSKSQEQKKADKCTCNQGKSDSWPCDPCKSLYPPPCVPPDPLLSARLRCQFVCPPGSVCPQVICKDPCGRTFIKVDGDMINFDPQILECEAKRAAANICPPCNADRIAALRKGLDICKPRDTDSCDEKLAEIFGGEGDGEDGNKGGKDGSKGGKDGDKGGKDGDKGGKDGDKGGKDGDKGGKDGDKGGKDGHMGGKDGDKDGDEDGDKAGGAGGTKLGTGEGKYTDGKSDGGSVGGISKTPGKSSITEDGFDRADYEASKGLFISAEFSTLENGKRRLDVKVKGTCRKSENYIKNISRLHIEGNIRDSGWYKLISASNLEATSQIQGKSAPGSTVNVSTAHSGQAVNQVSKQNPPQP